MAGTLQAFRFLAPSECYYLIPNCDHYISITLSYPVHRVPPLFSSPVLTTSYKFNVGTLHRLLYSMKLYNIFILCNFQLYCRQYLLEGWRQCGHVHGYYHVFMVCRVILYDHAFFFKTVWKKAWFFIFLLFMREITKLGMYYLI